MLKRFIFSLLMLTGVTAGAVHAEDVILRVVDPSGNNVPGTVSFYTGVGGWSAEVPTPHTLDLTVGNTFWGRSKFKGQFGGTGFATFTNLQNNMVSGQITEINISTGQISNKPGNGTTAVHFVYDAFQATFGVVDKVGADITGAEVVFTNLSQTYSAPHTLSHYFLDGQSLSVRGKLNGQQTGTKVVTVKKNTLQRIDAQNVANVTETPGQTAARIDFQYSFFPYEVAVTDLNGNPIHALVPGTNQDDLTSKMGLVSVNLVTSGFVPTGFTGSASNGTVIGVKGKFDNLESAFHSVTINEDHTVVISVGRDQNGQPVSIKSDPVETTGQTRVEFRYLPVLFTTEVVNELNVNLPDGKIRVTGLTDVGTTPTYVPSPFYAKVSPGRLMNFEVGYGSREVQFDLRAASETVYLFDQSGDPAGTSGTDAGKGGARVTFDDAPVRLVTTNGTSEVTGKIKIGSGVFQNSPVDIPAMVDGEVLNIEAEYLGVLMDNTPVTVKEGVTQYVDAVSGLVVDEAANGQTAIEIVFAPTTVEIVITDQSGNPIYNLDPETYEVNPSDVMGSVWINTVTGGFVPSGRTHTVISGGTVGVKGKFGNLESPFHSVQVLDEHTVVVNVGRNPGGQVVSSVEAPVPTSGVTRIEFHYEPVLFTTEVVNELNENLPQGNIRVVGLTDVNGQSTFVPSPFKAVVSAGRLMNFEIGYGTQETQFDLRATSGTIYLFDNKGHNAGTDSADPGQGGARVTFDDAPVVLRTTDGTNEVAGQIKIGSGNFENSPIDIPAMVDGQGLLIEAQYLGTMMDNASVTVKEGFTQYVNASTGLVYDEIENGQTAIEIVFAPTVVEVVVTDLEGHPIYNIDPVTFEEDQSKIMGEVSINQVTNGFVASGATHAVVSGTTVGVKGRFDNLESNFHAVQVLKDHTVVISVGRDASWQKVSVVSPPVETSGQTRIEFRFEPLLFTTEVVNELNINLPDGRIRVVGLTDVNSQSTFVPSPFKAKISAGRLMNFEVGYGSEETQFDLRATAATVFLLDSQGNQTGTDATAANESGARASFDDASVTIQTTEGTTPVEGEIKIGNANFVQSPVSLTTLTDGTVLNIEARFGNLNLDNVEVVVTEDHTITVNAITGEVGDPVSTPGVTLINLNFQPNVAPVLGTLTKPAPNQVPLMTSTVTVEGQVFDADGNLVSVVVTLDEGTPQEMVVTDAMSEDGLTYSALFENVSDGEHSAKIVATDALGETATQFLQFAVDTEKPVITEIDAPDAGVCGPDAGNPIVITVTATDNMTAPEDLVYAWTLDEVIIDGETSNSVSITLNDHEDHTLVVTVKDEAGNVSDPDNAEVLGRLVLALGDGTAPELVAELIPVIISNDQNNDDDDDGNGNNGRSHRSNDDNDDGNGNNGRGGKKGYEVNLEATDHCDDSPAAMGVIFQPVPELTDDVQVKYKKSTKKTEIKVNVKKNKTVVTLYGSDEEAMRALFGGAIDQGGFTVVDGQVLVLKDNSSNNRDDDDDDGRDDDDDDDRGNGRDKDDDDDDDDRGNGRDKDDDDDDDDRGNGRDKDDDDDDDRGNGRDKDDDDDDDDRGSDNGNNGRSKVSNDQNGDGNGNNGKSDVSNDKNSGDDDDDDRGNSRNRRANKTAVVENAQVLGTFKYTFEEVLDETDSQLRFVLVEASGPVVKMLAYAIDASGNASETVEVFPPAHNLTKPVLTKPVAEVAEVASQFVFGLEQNYPNPFNPATAIQFTLPEATDVRLVVYNILGQQVRVLMDRTQGAGVHTVQWNGDDELGRQVATGVYIYHLTAGKNTALKKMTFSK